jgi:ParB family chromosome partitioning protein
MSSDRRRGLGKGLGALIPSAPAGDRPSDVFFPRSQGDGFTGNRDQGMDPTLSEGAQDGPGLGTPPFLGDLTPVPGAHFAELPIDTIRPNPRQPRQVFDEDELAELVASIRELGVLQPIVVRPVPTGDWDGDGDEGGPAYELVMGERRLRASREAGKDTIPAIVRVTEDEHLLRDALLENLHRAQLNALEEAAAYSQLLEDFGCTHDELAARIGRSRPQISNTLRLLKLPPLVQRRVASGVLSAGHARALLGLPDGAAMERLAQRIVAEGLSVRSVEEIVVLGGDAEPRQRRGRSRTEPAPELQRVASDLSQRLETRVQVVMGRHKGRLTVEFADQEDLDRILAALVTD